jgi:hypothetical protein
MTFVKATTLTLVLAGAFGLGVWTSPYLLTNRMAPPINPAPLAAEASHATTMPTAAPTRTAAPTLTARMAAIPAASPELWNRLRPVLNAGTNRKAAAEGFRSAEQFATVAHAASNTGVQFQVLKQRVVDQHQTLAAAIREFRPNLDATAAVDRAVAMARGDLAAIAG